MTALVLLAALESRKVSGPSGLRAAHDMLPSTQPDRGFLKREGTESGEEPRPT